MNDREHPFVMLFQANHKNVCRISWNNARQLVYSTNAEIRKETIDSISDPTLYAGHPKRAAERSDIDFVSPVEKSAQKHSTRRDRRVHEQPKDQFFSTVLRPSKKVMQLRQ